MYKHLVTLPPLHRQNFVDPLKSIETPRLGTPRIEERAQVSKSNHRETWWRQPHAVGISFFSRNSIGPSPDLNPIQI